MTTSSRTTSGLSDRASKTASRAFPASPTTSMSSSRVEQEPEARPDDRVVVDHQDPDHGSGTSATSVVPRRAPTRPSACRRAARPARACRAGRARRRGRVSGRSPCRRPRSPPSRLRRRRMRRMLTVSRAGVLDDVRERLLDDPVERRLDLAPGAARRRAPARGDLDPGRLGEGLRQALERGDEAEVVERLRPQLDRQAADVLERRDDELAQLVRDRARICSTVARAPRPSSGRAGSRSAPGRSRRGARARAAGARAPGRRPRGGARRARPGARGRRRSAARVANCSASRRSASPKRGSRAELVVRDDDADRLRPARAGGRRARSSRRAAASTSWSTSGSSRSESMRSLRRRSSTRPAFDEARGEHQPDDLARLLAGRRLDPQVSAGRQRDRDEPRADQLAQALRATRSSSRVSSSSASSASPTSFSDSSWLRPRASRTRRAARSRSRPPPAPRAA